jgi:hypothetical protein
MTIDSPWAKGFRPPQTEVEKSADLARDLMLFFQERNISPADATVAMAMVMSVIIASLDGDKRDGVVEHINRVLLD